MYVKLVRGEGTGVPTGAIGVVHPVGTWPALEKELIAKVGKEAKRFLPVEWVTHPGVNGYYLGDRFKKVRPVEWGV